MLTLNELQAYLQENNSDFELIAHETPIQSTQDAAKYFDIEKAAPTLVIQTENGLLALIVSSNRGRVDLKTLAEQLGFAKVKMADRTKVQELTGYQAGAIPFIGHQLPCVVDERLLGYDYIFGGSGDECTTLKIAPSDVVRLNRVVHYIGE
ncbi:aminoacyl-tRNA deacylase [Paenibacillus kobensis]|uniref:aminoacyl-tRNA deacylase n=1 Tax=Paenibacillus kobensis TaxID=59841 RepID=UPI000FDA961C|nr:YbaK/EbsC family protein [Paenibacillus kobensis]